MKLSERADPRLCRSLSYSFLAIITAPLFETILMPGTRVSAISLMSSESTMSGHVYVGRTKIITVPLGASASVLHVRLTRWNPQRIPRESLDVS